MSTAAERHPHLAVVPPMPTQPPAPLEGALVEPSKAVEKVRPSWLDNRQAQLEAAGRHARQHHLYLPWVARGYGRAAALWVDRYHDDFPQMIATARQEARKASADKQGEAKKLVKQRRAEYRIHRLTHVGVTGAWTLAGGTGLAVGVMTGSLWVDVAAAVGAYLYGLRHGHSENPQTLTVTMPAQHSPLPAPDPGFTTPSSRIAEAAASEDVQGEALAPDEPELRQILAQLGFPNVTIVDAVSRDDGTRTITFDLGGTGTVTELRKKTEGLAAALGRDVTMVDIDKVPGRAGRASLWTAESDPFEATRPSPLLLQQGAIDSWRDGIPVAFGKRGDTIKLPLVNQNTLIGGTSRSGKGVGASNLIVGAAMDPMINLRIVSGKYNGEWDPYARTGVASTYFKPSPERLLALLQGLTADKDRRERDLGKHGKSKLIHSLIGTIGGIELLVIDELATYTSPGKPLREEILSALQGLSAVALGAGILMVLITQYPEVDVLPTGLAMNCGTKWAMRVDTAAQSNAILGAGSAGAGRDASKFDPPRPGLGWLVNPFVTVTDLARSFDLDEDERGEITTVLGRAAEIRRVAGRLAGQWDDPIEKHLLNATGLSSAAGGPKNDGVPGRSVAQLTGEQRLQLDALRGAQAAMNHLQRGAATLDEMAELIGGGMTRDRLGELLRAAGAGGAEKVKIDGRWTRGGYERADIDSAVEFLTGA
ncbi:hypothetical protein ACFXJO_05565 [Streptomyces lavendulae]|uniref:hypothetical protein n=1 Tax=Streptomyces lavendulae TaxID=1914 RepID=UPI00367ADC2F